MFCLKYIIQTFGIDTNSVTVPATVSLENPVVMKTNIKVYNNIFMGFLFSFKYYHFRDCIFGF